MCYVFKYKVRPRNAKIWKRQCPLNHSRSVDESWYFSALRSRPHWTSFSSPVSRDRLRTESEDTARRREEVFAFFRFGRARRMYIAIGTFWPAELSSIRASEHYRSKSLSEHYGLECLWRWAFLVPSAPSASPSPKRSTRVNPTRQNPHIGKSKAKFTRLCVIKAAESKS